MDKQTRIAVCSRSFSRNDELRKALDLQYRHIKYNDEGIELQGEALISFLEGVNKVIVGLEEFDEDILKQLPELEVISKYGVGLDKLDLVAMKRNGIKLGWTPGVNKRSVSELVVAFAINMLRHVPDSLLKIHSGEFKQVSGGLLTGRTVGVIGCGNIGKDLIPLLKAFNCSIQVYDIRDYTDYYKTHNVHPVSLENLLASSDIVTLHVPLDESTKEILNAEMLDKMKPTAILINLARGGLVDEKHLKKMLKTGRLAAAAFDVFLTEPPTDMELLTLPNFLPTPHIGGSAKEAILAMGMAAIEGLKNNQIPNVQASIL